MAQITVQELAAALRLTDGSALPDEPVLGILTGQLQTARELVNAYAPTAGDATRDSAIIKLCSFLYDQGSTALNNAPQVDALRMSGAMSVLAGHHSPF